MASLKILVAGLALVVVAAQPAFAQKTGHQTTERWVGRHLTLRHHKPGHHKMPMKMHHVKKRMTHVKHSSHMAKKK